MDRRFVVLTVAAAVCGAWLTPAQGADPNQFDYTLPAIEQFASTGTIAGLKHAFSTLDEGVKDTTVTGDKRQLILLHVAARAAMLVFDTNDVAFQTSLLDVGQPFGIGISGTQFLALDPNNPDPIRPVLPFDPNDPNSVPVPTEAQVNALAAAINNDILPELDSIITELNSVTNSPAFVMTLPAAKTGLPADIEVDWSDVLALKTWLLSVKAALYAAANPAYDFQVDLTNPIFAGWQSGLLPATTTINTILSAYPNLFEKLPAATAGLAQTKTNLLAALNAGIDTLNSLLAETDDQADDLLMMEAEDRPGNTILRDELVKFRNSLAAGSAATYTVGSDQLFNVSEGGAVIGQLRLKYDHPFDRSNGDDGWMTLPITGGDPVSLDIDWFHIEGSTIQGYVDGGDGMSWFWGGFTGTISADGATITSMTVDGQIWSGSPYPEDLTIGGLSAARTVYEPINITLNPGPVFAGTVSPRDAFPQFDPNGEPIPGTFGHGLNNDATLGGIFPAWTQQTWLPYGFEVWATNTNYLNDPRSWYIFRNPGQYGLTKLNPSSTGGNLTVSGTYTYYVIAAKGRTLVDSVRGSTGDYYNGLVFPVGEVEFPGNILGAPDGAFATIIGDTYFLDVPNDPFKGSVVLTNPGGWTGLTVITGGAAPLVTGAANLTSVVANGTSYSTITITVKDSFGTPVPGVEANQIVVSASPAGAIIVQPTAATNAAGQTTARIASTTAGTYRINVELNRATFSEVTTVLFTSGPANKLVFTVQPAGSHVADAVITPNLVVAVQDAEGNTITSSSASITMTVEPTATILGTNPVSASSGLATFSNLRIQKAGTYRLRATSPGLTPALSNEFIIVPQEASAHLVFTTEPSDSPAMGAIVGPPTVTVQDAFGNTVTALSPVVTLAIKSGTGDPGASLVGTNPVTAAAGVAVFNNVKITLAGTGYVLTATGTGATATESPAFNVLALPAMKIQKTHPAGPVNPGDDVTYTIAYGNEGLADGHNVVIRETLPAGFEFVSATAGGTHNGGVIEWQVGNVAADTNSTPVTFVAHVTDALGDGGSFPNSNLTIVCDGAQPVFPVTPDVTVVNDRKAPQVSGQIPEPNSISAALDSMIRLHVTDAGTGVAYTAVKIYVEGDLIYNGAAESPSGRYDSTGTSQAVKGVCRRTGTTADYTFTFLPTTKFNYEQKVDVSAQVADSASPSNTGTVNYSFYTRMRSFGANVKVNSDTGTAAQDNPAVATGPNGDIWIVWDQRTTPTSDADVYIARLPADANAFEPSVRIYNNSKNQANPAIAADAGGRLYVVWEQWSTTDPNHHIMLATSADGVAWVADPNTPPLRVNPNPPEKSTVVVASNPSITVSEANEVYIAWQETRNGGDSDIWVRSFTQAGGLGTATQTTTASAVNPTEPFVGIDANDSAYVLWTDARNAATAGTDIFGARADRGPWTEGPAPYVNTNTNQSNAVGATGKMLRIAWVDANDLKFGHLRVDVLDPCEPDALPRLPTLAALPTDTNDRVFVAWTDSRNVVASNGDTDIYFAEGDTDAYTTGDPLFGTNRRVNDDTGVHRQTKPALGLDATGNPFVVWVDNRHGNDDIFFAGSMEVSAPLSTTIIPSAGGAVTVQNTVALQVQIPSGALPAGIDANDITIKLISNSPLPPAGGFALGYDFGPSGTRFSTPVTIRIPLASNAPVYEHYTVYWYDPNNAPTYWSTVGIHNPATRDPSGAYLEVTVDHFTSFAATGYNDWVEPKDGGGGCALAPWSQGSPWEFSLPFAGYILVLFAVTCVDRLRRRSVDLRRR